MNSYIKQLEAAARAVVFHSPTTFSWFGKRSRLLDAKIHRAMTPAAARDYLVSQLQDHLYFNFYCRGLASPLKWETSQPVGFALKASYVTELSEANSGSGYWSGGWQVVSVEDHQATVSQGGLRLRVRTEECLLTEGASLEPRASISVRFPKEFPDLSPGFYLAAGDRELTQRDWSQAIRIYWNVTERGAVQLMRLLTASLNIMDLPFRLKVQKEFSQFTRCDAAVLYVRKDDYERMRGTLESVYTQVKDELRQGTPVFTKPLADGIGLAEEPLRGISFGLNRCRILADGLVSAYESGKKLLDERMEVINERFALERVSLEEPFLNPGSSDSYNFNAQRSSDEYHFNAQLPTTVDAVAEKAYAETSVDFDAEPFLQTAYSIGMRLCAEAVWYEGRCNWMGTSAKDPYNKTYSTLGPEVYSGTSGVGLFLAELYAATGDEALERTATGAIRQAFAKAVDVPQPARMGAYTGWVGIALAATRAALITRHEELMESARQLLHNAALEGRAEGELDLISGNAGAIPALIALADVLNDESLLDLSVKLGDELLARAVEFADGYSWKTTNARNEYPLTGFSHGAAGIGYALLELFEATGETRYSRAASMAFNYERYWFDSEARNWPDLREASAENKRKKHSLAFSTVWCHGAPGIALSRLRAWEILGDEQYKQEALIALETTSASLESSVYSGTMNFSLCHGLAGNADVLLLGSQLLCDEFYRGRMAAREVGEAGIGMHARTNHEWPCGAGGGTTPSLMLGLAGIGYFYLRLHNEAIPSMLMLQRERLETKMTAHVQHDYQRCCEALI